MKDQFHLVWTDGPSEGREFRYARSGDNGQRWTRPQTVDATTCACCWNILGNYGDKKLYGLYRDGKPRDMYMAVSEDGGEHWDLRSRVGEFGWIFDGCPHVGGGLAVVSSKRGPVLHAVVWTGHEQKVGVYYLSSADEGKTWTKPHQFGDNGARHADIVAAPNGTLVASWDDYVNKSYYIFASISVDGGKTWSEAAQLSEGDSATHPKVTYTSRGFRVFWTEQNKSSYITWKWAALTRDGKRVGGAAVPVSSQGAPLRSAYADEAS